MLARLQWSAFGLRGRIVGAVLVTTVATLVVATIVLLPQLERSLKNASLMTLEADVKGARSGGELDGIADIDYRSIPYANMPALRGTALARRGHLALLHLQASEKTLAQRLGTPSVTLIGYVDSTGHGRPINPDQDPTADSGALTPGPFGDVVAAYFGRNPPSRHNPYFTHYSFGSLGDQQVVRAAIRLPGDDAVLAVRKSIDEIPNAVSAVRQAFEIAALAGLLLTIVLAIPMAATLVRRLQRLRQAALRVAVEGTGAEFPLDRARDEVGDLARSFAIMQRRLRQQEEARRAFVATASHELRTPLTSLDGMLELLADDLQDASPDLADATALLDRARAQSRRLGRLAADLLDLSRIDADVALRSEPIELAELARAVLSEFDLVMKERGVSGVLQDAGDRSDPPPPVWALGDPGSIARILRILLDNALRVAPRGSEIAVTLSPEPQPTVRVIDSGPGIAQEERALIFERFKRGRDTGGEAGFGLGLAIGRELAERMGGALVLADSPAPGATFVLTLPPAPLPPEPPAEELRPPAGDSYRTQAPVGGAPSG